MAYDAKVLPVMIASPSDVEDEREVVRRELAEGTRYIRRPNRRFCSRSAGKLTALQSWRGVLKRSSMSVY